MQGSTWAITLTVAAALFMENMDGSIITTSLPAIAEDLATDPISLKLAFTTYLLGLTVFLPVSGWLADRYGAKHVFRLAIVTFVVASLLCGAAQNLPWLIAARALQGVGGALMVPVGRLILLRAVPKSELVDALALLALPALIGPLIGPPIGGFITTYIDWRWVFWMNVPPGILGLVLATWLMPEDGPAHSDPFDVRGYLLAAIGLTCTVFGLTIIGRDILSSEGIAAMVAVGVICLILYWFHYRRTAAPVLDLSLFKTPTFYAGVWSGSFFRLGVGAFPFLIALMLQLGFGLSAFESGLITCASAMGALLMKFATSRAIRRFGFRDLLIWNGVVSSVLLGANGLFTPATPAIVIMATLMSAAFFRSLQFTALNALSYADIETREMSRATSVYTVMQQLSLTLGVTLAAFILEACLWWRGSDALMLTDYAVSFGIMALLSIVSVFPIVKMAPNAGALVSGKQHDM
jgi:EmrB/QacA subfamily drug resistance transporter